MSRFLLATPIIIYSFAFTPIEAKTPAMLDTQSSHQLLAEAKSQKPNLRASSYKTLKTIAAQKALSDPQTYFEACMSLGKFWAHNLLNKSDAIDSIPSSVLNLKTYFEQASSEGHPAPLLWMEDKRILQFIPRTKDQNKIIKECELLAKKGDYTALEALMVITMPDKALADSYLAPFRKQAQNGNADVQLQLADLMLTWLSDDYQEEGIKWANMAREKGKAHASYLLAKNSLNKQLPELADNDELQLEELKIAKPIITEKELPLLIEAAKTGHIPALRALVVFSDKEAKLPLQELRSYLIEQGDLPTILDEITNKDLSKADVELLNQAKRLDSHIAWKLATTVQNTQQDLEAASKYLREHHNGLALSIPVEINLGTPTLRKLPLQSRTQKELSLLAQLGNSRAAIALGEFWYGLYMDADGSDALSEKNEYLQNMQHWYGMALELDEHPLAKLRLTQIEQPELLTNEPRDEVVNTLLNRCINYAKENLDVYTINAIDEYLKDDQWKDLYNNIYEQAQEGDPKAQIAFATMELYNTHTPAPNTDKAIAFAQMAANNGNAHGLYLISKAYIEQMGNEQGSEIAWAYASTAGMDGDVHALVSCSYFIDDNRHVLKMLADRGHLPSLLQLANELAYKTELISNEEKAPESPAEPKDDSLVYHSIGDTDNGELPPWLDEEGNEKQITVPVLSPEAIDYWERAAELGSYTALDQLATYYEKLSHITEDEALKQQYIANALSAGQRLLNKSDIRAYKRMARYNQEGFGIQPNLTTYKDYIFKAASLKDPESLVEKARILIKGTLAPQNYPEALRILNGVVKNENHDIPGLYFLLGYLNEEGLGTSKDTKQAFSYYMEGADRKDDKAMNNLGSMYEAGNGVDKNLTEAAKWYEEASKLGNSDAKANLERVKSKLN